MSVIDNMDPRMRAAIAEACKENADNLARLINRINVKKSDEHAWLLDVHTCSDDRLKSHSRSVRSVNRSAFLGSACTYIDSIIAPYATDEEIDEADRDFIEAMNEISALYENTSAEVRSLNRRDRNIKNMEEKQRDG